MELGLKHLAPYLPHGLDTEYNLISVDPNYPNEFRTKKLNENTISFCLKYCKPILRPLSDLTKEIKHKGNVFIPLEKISEDFTSEIDFIDVDRALWQVMNPYGTIDYSLWFETINIGDESIIIEHLNCNGKDNQNIITYRRYFQLCKWHFDVFGLIEKGLAIDINDIK